MSSRNSNSLAASSRSQSQIRRWTSGRGRPSAVRPRGKKPGGGVPAGSLLPLLPLLPHQETVRQHHQHRVAVEAPSTAGPGTGPSPATPWPPRELLHPVTPVRVLHHPLQRHFRPEVAPVVLPLASEASSPISQPSARRARRRHPPAAERDEAAPSASPCCPRASGSSATSRRLRRQHRLGPPSRAVARSAPPRSRRGRPTT